jgi:hypothetical protein
VRLGLPARHLQADFADHGLGRADIDAVDPGEVDAADAVDFTTQVELQGMAARLPAPLGAGAPRVLSGRWDGSASGSVAAVLSAKPCRCCSSA